MSNLHLVTGYAGQQHVTAADHGCFNAALFGSGQYVLGKGNKLSASVVTNNQIRVLDGDILMQGRHIRLNEDTYVDLTVENGAQGYYRNDLIVARYTKDAVSGVEEVNLVVIKGTAVTSNPSDPYYTSGDIVDGNDILNDMPLYRVPLNGLNVGNLVALFEVFDANIHDLDASVSELSENKQDKTNSLKAETAIADGDYFPFYDSSASAHKKTLWSTIKAFFADKVHTHAASDVASGTFATARIPGLDASKITSGVLSVARGGTGVSSLSALISALSAGGVARIEMGSYTGTGTWGSSNPTSLTFSFVPKVVFLLECDGAFIPESDDYKKRWAMLGDSLTTEYAQYRGFGYNDSISSSSGFTHGKKSTDGKTFYWYFTIGKTGDHSKYQFNTSGVVYRYLAIG